MNNLFALKGLCVVVVLSQQFHSINNYAFKLLGVDISRDRLVYVVVTQMAKS